uniref:Putative chaperone for wingless signaling and trafficking of ldl receptor n=1 Tax=Corethrella appendiculata TaxID=1370023 RepID=U5EXW9_9DIPT
MFKKFIILNILLVFLLIGVQAKKHEGESKPQWAKKDIRDYTDADMERLLDQWEEDEEPLEEDELPEHLRTPPAVDMSKLDPSNPEAILQKSKKGRTLMAFVTVSGNPTRDEADEITKLWQTSLWNSHRQAERYMISDDRAIFLFKDGQLAWEAKDFLIQQERCARVTIENKDYPGLGSKDEFGNKDEL